MNSEERDRLDGRRALVTGGSKGRGGPLSSACGRWVRVNSVSPGGIETEAYERFVDRIAEGAGLTREAAVQSVFDSLGGVPLGRFPRPDEVADLVGPPTGPSRAHPVEVSGVKPRPAGRRRRAHAA